MNTKLRTQLTPIAKAAGTKPSSYHARLSPSGAHRWTSCTASPEKQDRFPNKSSEAARAGTCCHKMAEEMLHGHAASAATYLGRKMLFWRHCASDSEGEDWEHENWSIDELDILHECTVTQEMVNAVDSAVAFVRQIIDTRGGTVYLEQDVPIGWFTGEEGATGSADVIILTDNTIIVIDFKFGRHKVYAYEKLSADVTRPNLQMASYTLGALEEHAIGHSHDITQVQMIIVQPFIGHVSEFACTVAELQETEDFLRMSAERTRTDQEYVPTFDNCHFCRAKGHCQAQRAAAFKTALDGFDEEQRPEGPLTLGQQYSKIKFVRDWAESVEQIVLDKLTAGERVDGYKLGTGRAGNRAWDDPVAIEKQLLAMRLKKEDIYESKLRSPAQLEEAKVLGKTQANRIFSHVVQPKGKPTIVVDDSAHIQFDDEDDYEF